MGQTTDANRIEGIMLSDGTEVPLACAAALARADVVIHALVVGPNVPQKAAEAIAGQFQAPPPIVVTTRPDQDPMILGLLDEGRIEMLLSCLFEYRIRPRLLQGASKGGVNIHTSVLPHNRGFHTSFWGIVDGTPLGATIHWMSEELDAGDIIAQASFQDDGLMSAGEVRQRQLALCVELFEAHLPAILAGEAPRTPQPPGGVFHHKRDIGPATTFDQTDTITMEALLRLARATHFGPHGFYVRVGSRTFKVQASVSEVTS